MKNIGKYFIIFIFSLCIGIQALNGQENPQMNNDNDDTNKEKGKIAEIKLDEISVTATRTKRKTQDVPAGITVIDKDEIDDSKMLNIKDALMGTAGVQIDSKNSGYDSRVVIRGAGTKARYGIREIMFLLNGVPITDPDGFSKLDLLDPFQIDRIEVVRGPNSTLWGANASGGIIHIITKDPLKDSGGAARVSAGQYGSADAGFYYGNSICSSFVYAINGSYRKAENSWRPRNKFEAYNVTLQPGFVFKDGSAWQNYLTFNKSDMQLPGTLNESEFKDFQDGGNAPETSSLWSKSGRYSDSLFYSTKYTKDLDTITFKPVFFMTRWSHYHPVYAFINVASAWTFGADIQADQKHDIGPVNGTLTLGVTGRLDDQYSEKYKYGDIESSPVFLSDGTPAVYISEVYSDKTGSRASTKNSQTWLFGVYIQESLNPVKDLTMDFGLRYDEITFNMKGRVDWYYSYYPTAYVECTGDDTDCGMQVENNLYSIKKKFQALSPRVGVSYRIFSPLSVYASVSRGIQTPTDSEIDGNPDLDLVTTVNYEGGFKGRGEIWDFDINIYQINLENEVVSILNSDGSTEYRNAGRTRKRGLELAGSVNIFAPVTVGGTFTYNDYKYIEFIELVRGTSGYVEFDRSGNTTTYSPQYIYMAFMKLRFKNGIKAKIETNTWGPYYVDAANSEKYDGYTFITHLMLGYEFKDFTLMINAENIFDSRYAVEVQKAASVDDSGEKSYSPASPRSVLFSLRYRF